MKQIINFVKHTFKDFPKDRREEIILSVTESLMEKVEDLIESGLEEQAAIDKAVLEFGNVEDYLEKAAKKEKREKRFKTISHYRNDLFFSSVATAIIIGILAFTNLNYGKQPLWFVIPAMALLFWPLSVYRSLLNKKGSGKNDDE